MRKRPIKLLVDERSHWTIEEDAEIALRPLGPAVVVKKVVAGIRPKTQVPPVHPWCERGRKGAIVSAKMFAKTATITMRARWLSQGRIQETSQ